MCQTPIFHADSKHITLEKNPLDQNRSEHTSKYLIILPGWPSEPNNFSRSVKKNLKRGKGMVMVKVGDENYKTKDTGITP